MKTQDDFTDFFNDFKRNRLDLKVGPVDLQFPTKAWNALCVRSMLLRAVGGHSWQAAKEYGAGTLRRSQKPRSPEMPAGRPEG